MERIYRIVIKEREGSPHKRYFTESAIRRDDTGRYYSGNEQEWYNTGVGELLYFNSEVEAIQHIEEKIVDNEYEAVEIIDYLNEAEDE